VQGVESRSRALREVVKGWTVREVDKLLELALGEIRFEEEVSDAFRLELVVGAVVEDPLLNVGARDLALAVAAATGKHGDDGGGQQDSPRKVAHRRRTIAPR